QVPFPDRQSTSTQKRRTPNSTFLGTERPPATGEETKRHKSQPARPKNSVREQATKSETVESTRQDREHRLRGPSRLKARVVRKRSRRPPDRAPRCAGPRPLEGTRKRLFWPWKIISQRS